MICRQICWSELRNAILYCHKPYSVTCVVLNLSFVNMFNIICACSFLQGMSAPGAQDELQGLLQQSECPLEFFRYAGQGHGFMNDTDWGQAMQIKLGRPAVDLTQIQVAMERESFFIDLTQIQVALEREYLFCLIIYQTQSR